MSLGSHKAEDDGTVRTWGTGDSATAETSSVGVIVRESLGAAMEKWKIFSNSTVVRATAGVSTLVATAVVVGAGWKWF
ncbi:hypothetical protein [Demequina flava]|uniref:hypothetical protein n=1 Tax=Demequina flava TaxID=1095025 RepID=UPI000784E9CC|nr:hypothetical protein [Demequina flava]